MIGLRMNVIAGSTKNLLVDLQNVSFLGSMGLRSILVPAQAVRRRGGKLAPEPGTKASNIDQVIPIFHELDAAVDSLQ